MSLIDDIKINSLSEAQDIIKGIGTEDIFEKAHKDGDLHPNGKWVWVSSAAGGKGDWRTLNGRTHKKHTAANGGSAGGGAAGTGDGGSKADNVSSISPTFQRHFSINNSKFTDPKKMSVSKTPQGNWSLSYDGKRISTVAPLTDADKKKLESVGVTFDDTFKSKTKNNVNSETYSHNINGVTVNVSKNKDGSYTIEANGKKVKSDDPSFFKDKLKPTVKKALAKEVGIEVSAVKSNHLKVFSETLSDVLIKECSKDIEQSRTEVINDGYSSFDKEINFNGKRQTIYVKLYKKDNIGRKKSYEISVGTEFGNIKKMSESTYIGSADIKAAIKSYFDDKSSASATKKKTVTTKVKSVPAGKRIDYDDDIVDVYDDKGKKIYSGTLDYCPFKNDDYKWNNKDRNYDLENGYKMVRK